MSDNKLKIECPACGCEMVKVFDQENGINIDICLNSCGGIFFDNRELEKFDESHEKDLEEDINNFIKEKEPDIIDIKFSVSNAIYGEEQIYCFSALILYK